MSDVLPPTPIDSPFSSYLWADWYEKVRRLINESTATITVGQGGTGIVSYAVGDLLYASAPTILSKRTIGSTGDVLTVSGGLPVWAAPYTQGTFTPTIVGDATAGVGTYTTQVGRWQKIGRVITFSISIGWTAHTGTGNITVAGLPSASAFTNVFTVYADSLTFANHLAAYMGPADTNIRLLSYSTGAGGVAVAMDTAVALLVISGSYEV